MNEDVFPIKKKNPASHHSFFGGVYFCCLFRLRIPTVFCHQNPPNRGPPRVQQSHYPPNACKQKPGWQATDVIRVFGRCCFNPVNWLLVEPTQLKKYDRQIGSFPQVSGGFCCSIYLP